MSEQELIYSMALTRTYTLTCQTQRTLLERAGSAQAVFEARADIRQLLPDATTRCVEAVANMELQVPRCEEELAFVRKNNITCLRVDDERYPARLRECADAPMMLYYMGHANLNLKHVLTVVGTRKITEYGKDMCRTLLREMHELCPDVLVVSGLAYGVDIHAHRAALSNKMPTVAVLAHGLDTIYPSLHRDTAVDMLHEGGLLTEYMSRTPGDKKNFVARNRIVAGCADAVLMVESADKGGSLITTEMAEGYHREVFACPGRVTDTYSKGCNRWIREHRATMVCSAQDIVDTMGWETVEQHSRKAEQGIQRTLFAELNADEQRVMDALTTCDGMHPNLIATSTGIPVSKISALLFAMEMKGLVAQMAGNLYRAL